MQQDWLRAVLNVTESAPTHWLPSTQGFVDACLGGLGWCLNPASLVRQHLASGRLVELVPGATVDVPLYWQVSRMAARQFPELDRTIVSVAKTSLHLDQ